MDLRSIPLVCFFSFNVRVTRIWPAANFHTANGACVWRVNFDANSSKRGWEQSYGLMAHYRYTPERVSEVSECKRRTEQFELQNVDNYAHNKTMDIGHKVQKLLDFSSLTMVGL